MLTSIGCPVSRLLRLRILIFWARSSAIRVMRCPQLLDVKACFFFLDGTSVRVETTVLTIAVSMRIFMFRKRRSSLSYGVRCFCCYDCHYHYYLYSPDMCCLKPRSATSVQTETQRLRFARRSARVWWWQTRDPSKMSTPILYLCKYMRVLSVILLVYRFILQ